MTSLATNFKVVVSMQFMDEAAMAVPQVITIAEVEDVSVFVVDKVVQVISVAVA